MVASVQSLALAAVARAAAAGGVLTLKPGQVLEALVLGKTPDGLTALKIGEMVVNAQLPQTLPPGAVMQLQVRVGGPMPQLTIVAPPSVPLPVQQPAPLPLPQIAPSPKQAEPPAAVIVRPEAPPVPSAQAMVVVDDFPASTVEPRTPVATSPRPETAVRSPVAAPATAPSTPGPAPVVAAPAVPSATRNVAPSPEPVSIAPAIVAAPPPDGQPAPAFPQAAAAKSESQQAVTALGQRVTASAPTPPVPSITSNVSPLAQNISAAGSIPSAPMAQPVALPQAAAPALHSVPNPAVVSSPATELGSNVPQSAPLSPRQSPTIAASVTPSPAATAVPPARQAVLGPPLQALSSPTPVPVAEAPGSAAISPPTATPAPVPAGGQISTPAAPVPARQVSSPAVPTSPSPQVSAAAFPTSPAQTPPAPIVVAAAPASAPEPGAASPLLIAQGAPRPQATMADLPKPLPQAMAPPAMEAVPPQPATPQAALAQMVPEAMARQNSLAPLLASLASIVGKSSMVPEPVVRAALNILAQRIALPASGPTADILRAAIAKSGVYLEASLAKSQPPAGDLKAGLEALKSALATWLGGDPAPIAAARQAAPPLKGMPPRVEQIEPLPLPDVPREAGRALHSQADAALSRVKLMQLASLPDAGPARGLGPELRTELPFLIGHELVMAQFQIFRDGSRRGKADGKRGWTIRFAMNFSGTGEVGAEVGLLGRAVNVALWAAEPEIVERLSASLPDLNRALTALGLEAGTVRVRNAPPDQQKPAAGHFRDRVS